MILYMYIHKIYTYIYYIHAHTLHIHTVFASLSWSYLRVNLKLVLSNWTLKILGEMVLYFLSLGKGNFLISFNFSIFKHKSIYSNTFHLRFSLCEVWNMGLGINRPFLLIFTLRNFYVQPGSFCQSGYEI